MEFPLRGSDGEFRWFLTRVNPTRAGDAGRLQQVFWNLLSNAVKFTAKNGSVHVRLEQVNAHVEVSVTDSGKGIHPEFIGQVFDRFQQADQTTTRGYGGLALGLSIVRQLVELHGGAVSVESPCEGNGSIITVELPRLAVAPHLQEEGKREHPARSHGFVPIDCASELDGLCVLIVSGRQGRA